MEFSNVVIIWSILGLILLASEVFFGTFHLLFFGLSALFTALVAYLRVDSIVVQVAIFGVLSMLSVYFVNQKFSRNRSAGFEVDLDKVIVASDDIKAGQDAVIQYQGSPWTAHNLSDVDILKGQGATIVRTEGVKLYLKSKH